MEEGRYLPVGGGACKAAGEGDIPGVGAAEDCPRAAHVHSGEPLLRAGHAQLGELHEARGRAREAAIAVGQLGAEALDGGDGCRLGEPLVEVHALRLVLHVVVGEAGAAFVGVRAARGEV